jgi:hypothetical protein
VLPQCVCLCACVCYLNVCACVPVCYLNVCACVPVCVTSMRCEKGRAMARVHHECVLCVCVCACVRVHTRPLYTISFLEISLSMYSVPIDRVAQELQ